MQDVAPKEKNVSDMLSGFGINGDLAKFFEDIDILGINVYSKSRKLQISLQAHSLISAEHIAKLQECFISALGIDGLEVKVKFNLNMPLKDILAEYWDSILYMIFDKVALSRGILDGCTWSLADHVLSISLRSKGEMLLKSQKCDEMLRIVIEESFGYKVKVKFINAQVDEASREKYLEFKAEQENDASSKIVYMDEKPKKELKQAAEKKTYNRNTYEGKPRSSGKLKKQDNPDVIIGRDFSDSIMKMIDVTIDSGRVCINGDIFRVESREIRGGRHIYIFDITDYTSSLTVKFFAENSDLDYLNANITESISVKLRGEAQYDKFSKELTILASDIVKIERKMKQDTAEVKRVELHLHTQMSAMDGVTPAAELVKRAAQWGHKAIAITDHGVAQAFPDAAAAAKASNIKILYGVECYLVDDKPPVVFNGKGQPLDGEYVVFDVETTGLDSSRDNIIEIGAVKIKNYKIIDEFSTFINPRIQIPEKIVELTGISDKDVKDAPVIEDILPEFIEFIGNAVLVAHNAQFDMGFLRNSASRIEREVNNTVVDTLQMSRLLFTELKNHKLNTVAQHLKISLENHHRAVDDSRATGEIAIKCFELLIQKGIENVDAIDNLSGNAQTVARNESFHAIILVKNKRGLKNLYRLISRSHLDYFYKKPRIPKSLLSHMREGLILGSACEAGELYRAVLDNKSYYDIKKIASFYDYLEIQPLGNNQFLIESGRVKDVNQLMDINRKIIKLGKELGKPVAATCDVHFMDPRDEVYRRVLMAGQGFSDADNQAPLYFRTTNEMLKEFTYLGEDEAYEVVVTNTNLIADMVEDDIKPIPEGTYPPSIEGAEQDIERISLENAKSIYGDPLPELVAKRLEKELNSIIKNGFSVMYIIAQKLVAKSNSDGYIVGSRGSVGSSFVATMSGITEVNPLPPHYICTGCKHSEFITDDSYGSGFDMPDKECPECGMTMLKDGHDIPFETFLGFNGDKSPDIDLNFSGEYQPKAHKYTEELFGEGHTFRAGTIGALADKTAYGFIKKYLDEREMTVTNAEVNRLVKGCTGIRRTTGQHPGGIIVIPKEYEVYDFTPVQRPADNTETDIVTTHFDFHSLHDTILKLDILGHTDPTMVKMLEIITGVKYDQIPLSDEKVMNLFHSTESLGIKPEDINCPIGILALPEFGTSFVRSIVVEAKPKTFLDLIQIMGLSHGTSVWLGNAQELIKNGTCNISQVIGTRDSIMLELIHYGLPSSAAFKIMESVRKGFGLTPENEQLMKENNVPDWYIDSCKKIKYMFPKAHAAAYAIFALRNGWYKVYYPKEFYAAYFTVKCEGDFDSAIMCKGPEVVKRKMKELEQKGNDITTKEDNILKILEVLIEMYARSIKFVPVDIYESDASKFQVTPEGIRPPLSSLQGLGAAAAKNIIDARTGGEFTSQDELRIRAKVSKAVIEVLKQQGCLEGIPESNQISLFQL